MTTKLPNLSNLKGVERGSRSKVNGKVDEILWCLNLVVDRVNAIEGGFQRARDILDRAKKRGA